MKLTTNHHLFKQIASLLNGDITYKIDSPFSQEEIEKRLKPYAFKIENNEIVDDPDANSGSKASDYD